MSEFVTRVHDRTVPTMAVGGRLSPACPCFCSGPWLDVAPADRPESVLDQEHETGDAGCLYVPSRIRRALASSPSWTEPELREAFGR